MGLHIAPDFPPELESVSAARDWLDRVFAAERAGGDGCEVCRLLVDELVANAIIHGDSDVEVTVNVADVVRVDVTNRGTDGEIAPIPYERGEPASHFGLHLVHGLSTSWGVTRDDDTTTVWFELPHPGPRREGPRSLTSSEASASTSS